MDPLTYMLLQKYQRVDLMKQVEQDRLLQSITQPSTQLSNFMEFSRSIRNWWNKRYQIQKEQSLVEGRIVMP